MKRRRTALRIAFAGVLVATAVAGCGGLDNTPAPLPIAPSPSQTPSAAPTETPAPVVEAVPPVSTMADADRLALTVIEPVAVTPTAPVDSGVSVITQIAAVTGDLGALAYTAPGGTVFGVIPSVTLATPTSMPVVGTSGSGQWLQVEIPSRLNLPSVGRANGASAWVSAAEVTLSPAGSQIVVDVAARTASVLDAAGAVVYTTPVAVGADGTPTPAGRGYIVDISERPGTATPRVLALSLHSAVLDNFRDDVAVTGIHTVSSDLATSGAVSNGCVRLPSEAAFAALSLPAGTPVTITNGDN